MKTILNMKTIFKPVENPTKTINKFLLKPFIFPKGSYKNHLQYIEKVFAKTFLFSKRFS